MIRANGIRSIGFVLAALALCVLTGCDTGIRQMGPTEYGVIFRKIPPRLGGGVSNSVIRHGQTVIVWPWDSVYRFDTQVHEIEWGGRHHDSRDSGTSEQSDYVQTRALDGNEVALAVRVQYSIDPNPASLVRMVQEVATSNAEVEQIVISVGRADLRTYMNELRTAAFFDNKQKFEAGERVKRAMQARLKDYGILIHSVNLGEHRFERLLRDGTIDASYQAKINEVQTRDEETKREKLRKATVEADKRREEQETQADFNRQVADAQGYKNQAKLKGDGYFQARSNESKAILARGTAEVEGLIEQINALSGPGGRAILKLELAKRLEAAKARFVVVNGGSSAGGAGVDVRKLDTNELLTQLGVFEAMQDAKRPAAPGAGAPSNAASRSKADAKLFDSPSTRATE